MPRIRTLKPECWQDEALGRVSRDGRLLFVGLITQADDDGRLRGTPALLRAQVFPYDDNVTAKQVESWTGELEEQRLLVRYSVKGESFLELSGWKQNQKISHPTPSSLPSPPEDSGELRVGRDRKGTDQGEDRSTERSEGPALPVDSETHFHREVVARFNEAATERNIHVDARLIVRVLRDFASAPPEDVRRQAFACADWLAANAPRNGSKGRHAHSTLRNFLKDTEPKKGASERPKRFTRPEHVSH